MLHQCYIADWERKEFEVFKRKLVPITLGHARLLFLAESPLVMAGAGAPTLKEILFAVSVCASASPPDKDHLSELIRMSPKAEGVVNDEEVVKFKAYLDYYITPIPRWSEKTEVRSPWPWMIVTRLMREFGFTEEQAWNTTVSKSLWMMACASISEGDTLYGTLEEQAIVAELNNG